MSSYGNYSGLYFSHGQASVELGFSINKNIKVENLSEQKEVMSALKRYNLRNLIHYKDDFGFASSDWVFF